MSRLMSVAFTEQAVVERRKTVTRRKGWWEDKRGRRILHAGDRLTLCRKVMGRKPGEPLVRLAEVEVVRVQRQALGRLLPEWRERTGLTCMAAMCRWEATDCEHWSAYEAMEMAAEGFPGMDPAEFIDRFFVIPQAVFPEDDVTRIEWRYLDDEAADG